MVGGSKERRDDMCGVNGVGARRRESAAARASVSRRGLCRAAALGLAAVSFGLVASACSREPEQAGAEGAAGSANGMRVVATTAMIGDVAREVGGDRVRVTAMMGEGVDPHLYKASPGDVRLLAGADLILHNGLHLEGRLGDVIERMTARTSVVRVTEGIPEDKLMRLAESSDQVDPHAWFDASLWGVVADRVRDALIEKDPAGKDLLAANAAAYGAILDDLHAYAMATLATIPEPNRVMVTAHDAFGYFGAAYGLEVLGIQGISTDSEASLRDINALVDTLVSRRVPAVFIESSVPRKTVDALIEGCKGRGHSVVVGGELFSDAMGRAGTLGGTYVGMIVHNVEVVTRSLGGVVPAQRPASLAAYLARHAGKGAK
jgi:manganese/zinc/iron transport system substrate-binding protein